MLGLALSRSGVSELPMIRNSLDPKDDLRTKLEIQVIPNTHWIRISLQSKDPKEAADHRQRSGQCLPIHNRGPRIGMARFALGTYGRL